MTPHPPPLRVLYRHYGGENTKPRPVYYSKVLALVSMLRAAEQLDQAPELVYVNDQVRPGPLLTLMEATGEVVDIKGGSDARSLRATFSREAARDASPDQFLWFAEDDYLYRPDALRHLSQGVEALPRASYVTVYGSGALDTAASRRRAVPASEPGAGTAGAVATTGDVDWYPAAYATSTLGTRRSTLRQDLSLLRFTALSGGAWDQASWAATAGYLPYTAAELRADLLPFRTVPPAGWPKALARGSIRVAVSARSLRRPSRRVPLFASDPELVHHMEAPIPGARHELSARSAATDWAAVAADSWSWGEQRGLPLGPKGAAA